VADAGSSETISPSLALRTSPTPPSVRFDHAESIENIAAHEMQRDIRLAARVCDRLAALRFEVAEIAESCMKQEPAATRRDLLDALAPSLGGVR
jgi:hypothetical protein